MRLTARNVAAATAIVAMAAGFGVWDHSWTVAVVWIIYFALLIARYHFFPPSRQPLHPPNESTLQFLRKRRARAR